MWWVVSVLGSLFFDSLSSLFDSFLGNRRFSSANAQAFYSCMTGIGLYFLILFTGMVTLPTLPQFCIYWALGTLEMMALNIYVRALKREDTSVCNALYGLSRVFTVVLGFFFLGELFTPATYAGIALIVLSGIAICVKDSKSLTRPPFKVGNVYISRAFLLIALASFLSAIGSVLSRYVVLQANFLNALFWSGLGAAISYLLVFAIIPGFRKEVLAERSAGLASWKIFLGNELCFLISSGMAFYAYSLAPAGIVRALMGLSPLFVILVAWIGTRSFPNSWREDLQEIKLRKKLFWIALMILGSYLIVAKS